MSETIDHPVLGTLQRDDLGYRVRVRHPAIARLDWPTRYPTPGEQPDAMDIVIEPDGDGTWKQGISEAARLYEGMSAFVDRVLDTLWRDVQGVGPKHEWWWHNNLAEVNECVTGEGLDPLNGPNALAKLLRMSGLFITTMFDDAIEHVRPVVLVDLQAAFETGHDVGLIFADDVCHGIGYGSGDISPFDPS